MQNISKSGNLEKLKIDGYIINLCNTNSCGIQFK